MLLVNLDGGRLSLEFGPAEFPLVQARLRRVACRTQAWAPIIRRAGTSQEEVLVGGVRLVLMADCGEPCLISTSAEGDALLRAAIKPDRSMGRPRHRRSRVAPADRRRRIAA